MASVTEQFQQNQFVPQQFPQMYQQWFQPQPNYQENFQPFYQQLYYPQFDQPYYPQPQYYPNNPQQEQPYVQYPPHPSSDFHEPMLAFHASESHFEKSDLVSRVENPSENRYEEIKNLKASMKNMEIQIGKLKEAMMSRSQGGLPSYTERPEGVIAICMRSGKSVGQDEEVYEESGSKMWMNEEIVENDEGWQETNNGDEVVEEKEEIEKSKSEEVKLKEIIVCPESSNAKKDANIQDPSKGGFCHPKNGGGLHYTTHFNKTILIHGKSLSGL